MDAGKSGHSGRVSGVACLACGVRWHPFVDATSALLSWPEDQDGRVDLAVPPSLL